ncbi:MAG: endonuclease YncB(thermonuclease family) [bacterium]|jgi:endonuclease YncB( thermonuclease family)
MSIKSLFSWVLSSFLFSYLVFPFSAYAVKGIDFEWKKLKVTKIIQVYDGDTFTAKIKGISKKQRIRLLYVDTPELSSSHKGKDLKFGKPAKQFLTKKIRNKKNILLWVNPNNQRGKYKRLLAVVVVGRTNINASLIRNGHSYFDTRFSFPKDYSYYTKAESSAFRKGKGIWSTNSSKKKYLKRLKREGKTVFSTKNSLYVKRRLNALSLKPAKYKGKFVWIRGYVVKKRTFRKSVTAIYLKNKKLRNGFPFISFRKHQKMFPIQSLQKGDYVQVSGFIQKYRNRTWQMKLHYFQKKK